mmetsp:Transcript_64659/g.115011  ORF Transcript_64659/g.115011 Transcript_64659/m.115011 type:complete len:259 (+) Transcript_64659:83-859(+)
MPTRTSTAQMLEDQLPRRDPSSKISLAHQDGAAWRSWGSAWAVEEWQEKGSETEAEPEPAPGLTPMNQAESMLPADLLEDIGFDELQDEVDIGASKADVSQTMTMLMSILGKNASLHYQTNGQTISIQEGHQDESNDADVENFMQASGPAGTFGYQSLEHTEDYSDNYFSDQHLQFAGQYYGDAITYDASTMYTMAHDQGFEGQWGSVPASTWGHEDDVKQPRLRKQPMVGRFCVFCGKPKRSTSQRFCSFCGQHVVA